MARTIMTRHECDITFLLESGAEDERRLIDIITPEDVTDEQIRNELMKAHDHLRFKDKNNTYKTSGETPDVLVRYVCEKNGWTFEEHKWSIALELYT